MTHLGVSLRQVGNKLGLLLLFVNLLLHIVLISKCRVEIRMIHSWIEPHHLAVHLSGQWWLSHLILVVFLRQGRFEIRIRIRSIALRITCSCLLVISACGVLLTPCSFLIACLGCRLSHLHCYIISFVLVLIHLSYLLLALDHTTCCLLGHILIDLSHRYSTELTSLKFLQILMPESK